MNEIGPNFIARPYRGVSVQDVDSLEEAALLAHVRARRVYRRTEFIVATRGDERALVQVEREDGDGILVGVRDARILASPDEIAFVEDESIDTGNASQLARVAGDARITVVQGRFQHVNFIVAPAPKRIRVVEVVPPLPPKLLEMARAVLDFDKELPPVELAYEAIDMRELARGASLTCSRVAAPGWRSTARGSTSSMPARRARSGRSWAASARARSTRRSTARIRARGSTSVHA